MASPLDKVVIIPDAGSPAQTAEALSTIGTRMLWGAGAPVTVSQLPAAAAGNKGLRTFVTDASTTLILGLGLAVVGNGANNVPVYSDGTTWRIG